MNDLKRIFKNMLRDRKHLPETFSEYFQVSYQDIENILSLISDNYVLIKKNTKFVSDKNKLTDDVINCLLDYSFGYDFNRKCWHKELIVCEFCRNRHTLEIFENGEYFIYDSRGNDVRINEIKDLPNVVEKPEDIKNLIDFYSNII